MVGGTSAEFALKTAKYASAKYLDTLPSQGSAAGHGFRDRELEQQVLGITRRIGIGAQFGGKYFCHDVRVIRLPRHGASCPVAIAVSCSADRQALGKITADGVFLEQLETDPAQYLPDIEAGEDDGEVVRDRPEPADGRDPRRADQVPGTDAGVADRAAGRGPGHRPRQDRRTPGRGRAHARLPARSPRLLRGAAKTPEGYASGSFGPTTAGRMDSYVDRFQAAGGSLVMLAKGNRSAAVTAACKQHGGFYLGSIGGAAARLAQDCITRVEVLEYPELGMEAVWKIEVRDFPAFIVVDDKGNDFFADPSGPVLRIGLTRTAPKERRESAPEAQGKFRIEHDSMGEVEVPADALWGAQTQRAVENFPVSGERIGRDLIGALGCIKGAAARVNGELGVIDADMADAIHDAAAAVARGEYDDQFPVDVFQTGSGTSSNMNANEVIATLATRALGRPVHPNDDVNASQSSNDVFPSAIHLAAVRLFVLELVPGAGAPRRGARGQGGGVRGGGQGRTDPSDGRGAGDPRPGVRRVCGGGPSWGRTARGRPAPPRRAAARGTAVGTGLNAPPGFAPGSTSGWRRR